MPLVSVVVPIYNVEPYLRACLRSVSQQTLRDLEVIMVDDGSTDGSTAIAEEFAARNPRFRLISQPNGGLGNARNTGADAASGEFLGFVDADDVVPRNAYELLLGALEETRSDFATGNVHRMTDAGTTSQAPFLARTFAETRLKTHVTKFRPLLEDRIVPNKLWRKSFWDAQGLRFPEGMLHEDIPVVVPAQFAARSVDVIAEPVYLYRIREGADPSITQRRAEKRALLDRITAIESVLDQFARDGRRRARRWYERSVVGHDLSYYLNVLDIADDEYREIFLERVNRLLDRAVARRLYGDLLAIDRLKWHLVRRRLMPELLEVLRFQKERLRDTPPVRVRGRWYGDYPFRTDRRLRIPRSVYLLGGELTLAPHLDEMRWDGEQLRVEGYAFIGCIGAARPGSQRVAVTALRPGPLRPLRQRAAPVRLATSPTERPDVTAMANQSWCDASWSGFVATLDARRLRRLGRWREGSWDLHVTVRAGGVTRRRARFSVGGARAIRPVAHTLPGGALVRASPAPTGQVAVRVETQWASVAGHRVGDGAVELSGRLRTPRRSGLTLRLVGSSGLGALEYPLELEDGEPETTFSVRVRLADLHAQVRDVEHQTHHDRHGAGVDWDLYLVDGGRRRRMAMADDIPEAVWPQTGYELFLHRTRTGDAGLAARAVLPLGTEARWTGGGVLELSGILPASGRSYELALVGRDLPERHLFPVRGAPASGRFEARLTPASIPSLAGERPLRAGGWDMYIRAVGEPEEAGMAPLVLAQTLYRRLPLETVIGHKRLALGMTAEQRAFLAVDRDLDDDERGRFHQRRLRESAYAGSRAAALRDAVVYSSFGGLQYSDSPRAIHEELVRREAPVEHLWVVHDGVCRVPPPATAVRDGSREHYEALARARFVVTNDHFPDWFRRRSDQVCLQTWHGTPLKRTGLDVPEIREAMRRAERPWSERVANWQYTLSPNRFSTPILRRAYAIEGELLETGYPRDDVLLRPDRELLASRVRERLALPADRRVVLYAPTYRDQVVDSQGRHRLDTHLDLDRLGRAIGADTVLLFRKHHRIADAVPGAADGFVRDVSAYPDATELLLVVDVLVTDYSSIMFDFAGTGRPMLFFTYDLEAFRDEVRGFYLDFESRAPGPLLRTTEELADALSGIREVPPEYADRYRSFASTFCELDDGRAAARVVDRVFPW